MKSEKKYKFHRRSIRLKEWDYGSEAAYFITLLAYQRGELFGKVVDEKMELNNFGKLIQEEWLGTPCIRINVVMDEFVIMPEHLHGIIMITDGLSKGVSQYDLTEKKLVSPSNTLGAIIRGLNL